MKKTILFVSILTLFIACGGVKKTQKAVNTGNYSDAINQSLRNLTENKTKKGNQPYVLLLEDAFAKNTERELEQIVFLQKDSNPANYEAIYKRYNNLKQLQEKIRPLMPLKIYEEKRDAKFALVNYDDKIITVKEKLSKYLYTNAENLLKNATSKQDYRKAYDDYNYLSEINPGYSDSKQKMEVALSKGIDYVKVDMLNSTHQIIPNKLAEDLLNFNTYGLDDLWIKYHKNPLSNINYDYGMQISLNDINISPEQVKEKDIIKEKQVKDGYKYALDSNGNEVKDSLGRKIKIDKFKTLKCRFHQFTQFKSVQVTGKVNFTDLNTKQEVNSRTLSSGFVFEHSYANSYGNQEALDSDLIYLLDLEAVPFPSNEQMVFDAGEKLKSEIKDILLRQRF